MNIPSPINANAPTAAPTPMPALAPVERPLSGLAVLVAGAVVELVVSAADVVLTTSQVNVDEAAFEDDANNDVDDTAAANFLAIVYRGTVLSWAQQESLCPQHHIVEFAVPSHGVTI
jgi:hypothetical protein